MFSFVKSYTQMFMTGYLLIEISENKNTRPDTYINNYHAMQML